MIYLDNAATTSMLPEVIDAMCKSMQDNFGNPSSSHAIGRKAKTTIETVRKSIAKQFNVSSSEIIFTSSGTEGNNLILQNAVKNLEVRHIITSKLEHHAVLNVLNHLQELYNIHISYLDVNKEGVLDLNHLEKILSQSSEKTLVSLMMVNNEIGNILPLDEVGIICKCYNALFHSDAVQAIGHYKIDLQKTSVDFITASAHKFKGPKGVGFVFVKRGLPIYPIFFGGNQEKGVRSSTENIHGIIGMGLALNIAYDNLKKEKEFVLGLKKYFIKGVKQKISNVEFNGMSADINKSSYTIVNVRFPVENKMFLFHLDMKGVSASAGSACQSGSNKKSHVLETFLNEEQQNKASIRFSFSKYNTQQELDTVIHILGEIL